MFIAKEDFLWHTKGTIVSDADIKAHPNWLQHVKVIDDVVKVKEVKEQKPESVWNPKPVPKKK